MNSKKGGKANAKWPGFFKVYYPDTSSKRLLIPHAFIGSLSGAMPNKVVLRRCSSGKCWDVKVKKTESGVYFEGGWERFVKENSLDPEDAIVFEHVGDCLIDFRLYGYEIEKDQTIVLGNSSFVKEAEDANVEVELTGEQNGRRKRGRGRPRRGRQ